MDRFATRIAPFVALVCMAFACVVAAAAPAAQQNLRPDIAAFIDEMVVKHGFDRATLRAAFARVQIRPGIVRAMSAPATARPWYEFRARYLDPLRINGGVKFWQENRAVLARARDEFGIPEEIIVATIGIETLYGRQTGRVKILDALTTLAFEYPRRAEYFRRELEKYLLLAREANWDMTNLRGSYAGALGLPQFMPSSYEKYAIDYDGDGVRDLMTDAADAIGSIANYYRSFGWDPDGAIVVPAEAGESGVDAELLAGIEPRRTIAELRQTGIVPLAVVPDEARATVLVLETENGPRYWLGLQNFYVITRYNKSVNYAMAVYELAREIRTNFTVAAE